MVVLSALEQLRNWGINKVIDLPTVAAFVLKPGLLNSSSSYFKCHPSPSVCKTLQIECQIRGDNGRETETEPQLRHSGGIPPSSAPCAWLAAAGTREGGVKSNKNDRDAMVSLGSFLPLMASVHVSTGKKLCWGDGRRMGGEVRCSGCRQGATGVVVRGDWVWT